jgi:hypothetical protein
MKPPVFLCRQVDPMYAESGPIRRGHPTGGEKSTPLHRDRSTCRFVDTKLSERLLTVDLDADRLAHHNRLGGGRR